MFELGNVLTLLVTGTGSGWSAAGQAGSHRPSLHRVLTYDWRMDDAAAALGIPVAVPV